MSTEIRLSIDTRAFLVAGATAGAAFALYHFTQSKGSTPSVKNTKEEAKADPSTSDPALAAHKHAQQLQLHYASNLTPALMSVSTHSQRTPLLEVPHPLADP